ncbi:MAG: ribokinase [Nakamurella sp.]
MVSSHGQTPRVAVVGSYGVGLTMRVGALPTAGETVTGATFSQGAGGKGSNQAIGAARLGAEVSLLTAVGKDEFGMAARALWRSEGIDESGVVTVDAATMVGFILVEADGENRIIIAPGALDRLGPDDVDTFAASIAQAHIVMVCNEIPIQTVVAALRTAHHLGVPTLFNPAPARDLPADARRFVDVLTPNLGEGRTLAGLDETAGVGEVLDRLRQMYTATIVLTAGSDGAYVDEPSGARVHVDAIRPTAVVDTTGAGDAFNAALAVALCRGDAAVAAAQFAVAAGAFSVSKNEATPGLPTPGDIAALLSGTASRH